MKPYPVFLVGLAHRRSVVIGGGAEAERKTLGLLECDADVTVIAASLTPTLRRLTREGRVQLIERNYRPGDLRGAFVVIAAETDPSVAARIWEEAESEGILVNVLDDTDHCSFVAGSVVRQGPLTLAISTSGCAPALAVRLRQRIARELGPEYAALLHLLSRLRAPLARRFPDAAQRRKVWYELVDSELTEHLRDGRSDLARDRVREITGIDPGETDEPGPRPGRGEDDGRTCPSGPVEANLWGSPDPAF